jgi:hypothetical protein
MVSSTPDENNPKRRLDAIASIVDFSSRASNCWMARVELVLERVAYLKPLQPKARQQ